MSGSQRDLVFISYSHKDKKWLSDLLIFLKPYQRKGLGVWADPYIEVGSRWERDIEHALSRTCVGVLLVSQEFLNSDFIYEEELPQLKTAADNGDLTLVCVPLSSFTFLSNELDMYQWARDPQSPLSAVIGNNRKTALVEITNAIVEAASKYNNQGSEPVAPVTIRKAAVHSLSPTQGSLGHLHGVPQQRPNHIQQVEELRRIKALILNDGSQAVGITAAREQSVYRLGVQGRGGIGKTVLAIDLANDTDVRRTFTDGVYWATLGQKPALEQLQANLLHNITGHQTAVENPRQGRQLLTVAFAERNALLVLDDVWQPAHAEALDGIGLAGRLIITTRDSTIVTAMGAEEMTLDVLNPETALELLAQWSGTSRQNLPLEARELAEECGRLPLALTLAGAQMRDGRSPADLLAALRAGRLDYLDHPYGSVFSSMQLSVDMLTAAQKSRLLELAIFPEDISIPETTIQCFWNHTAGLADFETRALLQDFKNKGLLYLRSNGDNHVVVELHDLQRDFLIQLLDQPVAMHEALLQAHLSVFSDMAKGHWWLMPAEEPYLWDWLGWHLCESGRMVQFRQLLFEYRWLRAKLQTRDLNHLLSDFDMFPESNAIKLLRSTLELSAHVLKKAPDQLSNQLLGRLIGINQSELKALCESIKNVADEYRLIPLRTGLTNPGGPLKRTLTGHVDSVNHLVLTEDGQSAISASDDKSIKVWDLKKGELQHDLRGHKGRFTSLSLSEDGRHLASASYDETIKVWDIISGKLINELTPNVDRNLSDDEDFPVEVSLSADGQHVVSVSIHGVLIKWDINKNKPLHTLRSKESHHKDKTLTPDGRRAVTLSEINTIEVWDMEKVALLHELCGHNDWIRIISISPNGERMVSVSNDQTIKVWDVERGEFLSTISTVADKTKAVYLSQDGRRAVFELDRAILQVWDLEHGELLHTLHGHEYWINEVCLSKDGRRMISASYDNTLKVWDIEHGRLLNDLTGHEDNVLAGSLTDDGHYAVSASSDCTLKVWRLDNHELIVDACGHQDVVRAVALSVVSQRAVSGSYDGTLKVWDLEQGVLLHDLYDNEHWVDCISITPDGRFAVSASADFTIKVRDIESGTLLHNLRSHELFVNSLCIAKDGTRFVSASNDGTLKIWDLKGGKLLHTLYGHKDWVKVVTLTADGKHIVSAASDGVLISWDFKKGRLVRELTGHDSWVSAISISANSGIAVSGSHDTTIKVWDLMRGRLLHDLYGHKGTVNDVVILPDGNRAASVADDGILKLWDIRQGILLRELHGHEASIKQLQLSRDGRRVVTASDDCTLKVWDLTTNNILTEYYTDAAVTCISMAPNGPYVVAGDALGNVHLLRD
ncbi:MAG: NB-ARC domain-containing protein [Candidatus Thiodiazotropha sp.]